MGVGKDVVFLKASGYKSIQICVGGFHSNATAHLVTAHFLTLGGGGGQKLVEFSGSGSGRDPGLHSALPARGTPCVAMPSVQALAQLACPQPLQ